MSRRFSIRYGQKTATIARTCREEGYRGPGAYVRYLAAGLDAEDLAGPTCESYECSERATVEFTITWCSVEEGEVTDTVYLCDECAAEYRAGTRAKVTGERRLNGGDSTDDEGYDEDAIDDLECFGHFDGECVCKAGEVCECYSLVAHAALFVRWRRYGIGDYIEMTAFAGGTIICAAPDHMPQDLFKETLRCRFPGAQITDQGRLADPGRWQCHVQVDDVRDTLTVEECQRWVTLFGPDDNDDPQGSPPTCDGYYDIDCKSPATVRIGDKALCFLCASWCAHDRAPDDDPTGGIFNPQPFSISYPPAPIIPMTRNDAGEVIGLHCLPTEAWRAQMRHALMCGFTGQARLLTEIQVEAEAIAAPHRFMMETFIEAFLAESITDMEVA